MLSPQIVNSTLLHSAKTAPSLYTPNSGSYPVEAIPTPPISTTERVYSPVRTQIVPTGLDGSTLPEGLTKVRAQTAGSAFDVSPEIGHMFIQPAHEKLFGNFYDRMTPYFPFAVLTNEPAKMRQERPFTYVACVMAAAYSDPTLQYRISRDALKYLGEHMLLRGEKSLDILQGLLIMINWYHVYTHSNPQLMNLLHLAKALLVDLGLNRPPGTGLFQIRPSNDANKMLHGQQQDCLQHSLEERRALLGTYHVQAKLSACFRRLDTMYWSEQVESCCQMMQDNTKRDSDPYAVAIVRLDNLVDRYSNVDGGQQKLTMPVQTYVRLFSADLESFKQNLPLFLQGDTILNLHIQNAQICVLERAINADGAMPAHKVEALHACLAGVVEYFESFMSQKAETLPCIPFLMWATIAHAFDIYAKLSFIEAENWDLEYVRNNPGFIAISDAMIRTLNEAAATEDIRNPKSTSIRFKISISRIEKFKQWYLSRVDLESKARTERLETEPTVAVDETNFGPYFSDFADIVWQDFTTDWSYFDNTFNAGGYPQSQQ